MNRRGFLTILNDALLGTAAAMTLDPELGLWRPGAKMISIPKASSPATLITTGWSGVTLKRGDIIEIEGIYGINPHRYIVTEALAFHPVEFALVWPPPGSPWDPNPADVAAHRSPLRAPVASV